MMKNPSWSAPPTFCRIGREVKVEQDQIRPFPANHADGSGTVNGREYLVTFALQRDGQCFQNDLIVIHHQKSSCPTEWRVQHS